MNVSIDSIQQLSARLPKISDLQREAWVIFLIFGATWLAYIVSLAIYRLYLSPIAKFPGPKLAAMTQIYEMYFDMVKKGGGQFPFEIKRMHQKYGPIVRVNPFELHIDDPDFYDTIYATSKNYDKMEHFQYRFNVPMATFSTSASAQHRIRRAAINPFFSKSRVRGQSERVQMLVDTISHRLTTEYAGTNKVLNVHDMWGCYTADAIMDIVFARPKNFCKYEDFKSPLTIAIRNMTEYAHITLHFSWFISLMNIIPNWLCKIIFPPFKPVLDFSEDMALQIADILSGRNREAKESTQPTVFHEILSSALPPHELSPERLNNEAVGLVAAGTETTSWSLAIGTFHILNNKVILEKLQTELSNAMPDPNRILPWAELEKLEYLDAIVKEVLRVAFGGVERLPRINRTGVWKYGEWSIPLGTPVGMDQFHMHTNSEAFPEPQEFRPERWLGNPKCPDGIKPLTHYLTPFAKGTRNCVGLNLAYAEMFIGIATIFRRHKLELFETTLADVQFYRENLKAVPWPGSKGVRVLVKRT